MPDFILFKRGRLTAEEREEIKKHPVFSSEILSNIPGMKEISLMVLHHHERYGGTGYPAGLVAHDIPLGAHFSSGRQLRRHVRG
ncbi:MAG: HD domain-containing phosphohydrolase [Bacillota bacterium]